MRDVAILSYAQTPYCAAETARNEVEMLMPVLSEAVEKSGIPRKEIARRFGTDKDSIGPILRGEVWKKIYRQFYPDSSQ